MKVTIGFDCKLLWKLTIYERCAFFLIEPIPPEKYIPRVLTRLRVVRTEQSVRILDFSLDPEAEKLTEEEVDDLQEKCEKLLMIADSAHAISGRSPIALACAVMHLACTFSLSLESKNSVVLLNKNRIRQRIRRQIPIQA